LKNRISHISEARMSFMLVAFPGGRVLVTGGHRAPQEAVTHAEIFYPGAGKFHATGIKL